MRKIAIGVLVTLSTLASVPAWADADDDAWIKKCQQDNKKEGATPETVTKYCACMNNKMPDDEKKSVSAWEQSHPKEMAACEAEAGWK